MNFMFNRFLMCLFKTNKIDIIQDCINHFKAKFPSSLLNDSWSSRLRRHVIDLHYSSLTANFCYLVSLLIFCTG
jgi:hypothetical protein